VLEALRDYALIAMQLYCQRLSFVNVLSLPNRGRCRAQPGTRSMKQVGFSANRPTVSMSHSSRVISGKLPTWKSPLKFTLFRIVNDDW